jgi:hypothetical protein
MLCLSPSFLRQAQDFLDQLIALQFCNHSLHASAPHDCINASGVMLALVKQDSKSCFSAPQMSWRHRLPNREFSASANPKG